MKADKRCTDQDIDVTCIKQFPLMNANGIQSVSCNSRIPRQTNGYDCGVFTIKFFEMVMNAMPSSTQLDIDNRFGFTQDAFGPDDIDAERVGLKKKIMELSLQWRETWGDGKVNEDTSNSDVLGVESGKVEDANTDEQSA